MGATTRLLILGTALACAPAAAARLAWSMAAPMPTGKGGHVAGVVGGKVLTAGGTYWSDERTKVWTGDLHVYDPASDTWSEGPAMPFPLSYGAGATVGDRLYIVSGSDGRRDYPETIICARVRGAYHWLWGPPLPAPRIYAGAAVVGTKLYVIGGAPDNEMKGRFHNDALVLDTARPRDGWRTCRAMPGPGRALMAAAAVGDTIHVFGGYVKDGARARNSADAFKYDAANDRWRRLPSLPFATRGSDAVAVNDRVYLLGGYVTWPASTLREDGFSDKVLRLDEKRGEYLVAGELPLPLIGCNPRLLSDGRVFIHGGEDRMKHRTDLAAFVRLP